MTDNKAMEVVRNVLKTQNLGVLATFGEQYPYTSLVGFVEGEDEKNIIFPTSKKTRKYTNLTRRPEISILINTGENRHSDFKVAAAVTAFGKAIEVTLQERVLAKELYLKKFPFLEDFVNDPACAFIKVDVKKYVVVTRFQEINEVTFE